MWLDYETAVGRDIANRDEIIFKLVQREKDVLALVRAAREIKVMQDAFSKIQNDAYLGATYPDRPMSTEERK